MSDANYAQCGVGCGGLVMLCSGGNAAGGPPPWSQLPRAWAVDCLWFVGFREMPLWSIPLRETNDGCAGLRNVVEVKYSIHQYRGFVSLVKSLFARRAWKARQWFVVRVTTRHSLISFNRYGISIELFSRAENQLRDPIVYNLSPSWRHMSALFKASWLEPRQ